MNQVQIGIFYHSAGGHVAALAKRIADGAMLHPNAHVDCLDIEACSPERLSAYQGIALGCPTRFGNISAAMKAWLEETLEDWYQNGLQNTVACSFTVSGGVCGDKAHTLAMLNHFCLMQGCILIGNPLSDINTDRFAGSGAKTRRLDRDGRYFDTIEGDIAAQLGKRLADITFQFHNTTGENHEGTPF